jgi:hypothetical protein
VRAERSQAPAPGLEDVLTVALARARLGALREWLEALAGSGERGSGGESREEAAGRRVRPPPQRPATGQAPG